MKINTKIIIYFLGFLLLINGGFMFLTALLSYIYQDGITNSLLMSGLVVTVIGIIMLLLNKNHDKQINKREGYLVVVLGWLVMIFTGTIPYIFTGSSEEVVVRFTEVQAIVDTLEQSAKDYEGIIEGKED